MNAALEEFSAKQAEFMAAADDAQKAVQVTLSWVGAGEKVLALAYAVLKKRLAADPAAGQPGTPLDGVKKKLATFAAMRAELTGLLPGLLG